MTLSVSQAGNSGGQTKKTGGGPPPEILSELQKYGLQPTGSLEGDKAAIAAAKTQQGGTEATETEHKGKKPHKPGGPGGPPPDILAQLQELGLSPQGSLQADMAAINAAKAANAQQGTKMNAIT